MRRPEDASSFVRLNPNIMLKKSAKHRLKLSGCDSIIKVEVRTIEFKL